MSETNAERVASIKELTMKMHERELAFMHQIHDEDMDWYKDAMFLIEQAERNLAMEENLATFLKNNRRLREENKKLREALQEIRDLEPLNHVTINSIARQALEDSQ